MINLEKDAALLDQDLLVLAKGIRQIPDREPPADLVNLIMADIPARRSSSARRLWRWVTRPRTFTITPLQLAPALAMGVMLLAIVPWLWSLSQPSTPVATAPLLVPTQFTLTDVEAKSVALVGSFNQWNPSGFEMRPSTHGNGWIIEVQLPPGRHEYAFLVNDEAVMADPRATFTKSDGFGNKNSVILVNHETRI